MGSCVFVCLCICVSCHLLDLIVLKAKLVVVTLVILCEIVLCDMFYVVICIYVDKLSGM